MKRLFLALLLCAGCAQVHKQDVIPPFCPVGVIVTPTPDATFDTEVKIALTQTEKSVETVEARETTIPLPLASMPPQKPIDWNKIAGALITAGIVGLFVIWPRNEKPKKRKGRKK